jgi:O-antigen/teichoic acid export membrane protein
MNLLSTENQIRLGRWSKIFAKFFLGQGLVQVLGAVAGFYLLRWMSVEDYAMFTLAFGVQSLFVNVVDPGFSTAITPLAGAKADDPAVISRYMAAALSLRKYFFLIGAAGVTLMLILSGQKHGWSELAIAGLSASVVVNLWTLGIYNVSANALVATQKVGTLHLVQNIAAVIRLVGYVLAHLAGVIGGVVVMAWNTTITIICGRMMALKVEKHERIAPIGVIEERKEMWHFVKPLIPLAIYTSAQGSITILIVSLFGNTTTVAETGALSRLQQLFGPVTYLIGWIIAPYFARISSAIAYRRFIQLMALGLTITCLGAAFAWILPSPFLWLLGSNYVELEFEVFLTMLSSGVGSCAALAYNLIYARKLVKNNMSLIYIVCQVGLQLLLTPWIDLSTSRGAITLGLSAALGSLIVSVYTGLVKLRTL